MRVTGPSRSASAPGSTVTVALDPLSSQSEEMCSGITVGGAAGSRAATALAKPQPGSRTSMATVAPGSAPVSSTSKASPLATSNQEVCQGSAGDGLSTKS